MIFGIRQSLMTPTPPNKVMKRIEEIKEAPLDNRAKAIALRNLHSQYPDTKHPSLFIQKMAVLPLFSPSPSDDEMAVAVFCSKEKFKNGYSARPSEVSVETDSKDSPTIGTSGALTKVQFGGGLEFIEKFFKGESPGYRCDKGLQGIYVTLEDAGYSYMIRTPGYALRTGIQFGQTPAIVEFEMPENRLKKADNSYEAIVLPKDVGAAQNVNIREIQITRDCFGTIVRQNMPSGRITLSGIDYSPFIREAAKGDLEITRSMTNVIGAYSNMISERW